MFSFIVTRLVRQVFDGMSAAHAAQVLHERPVAVLKAYLRECGVMDGDTFVDGGLEALCWQREGREEVIPLGETQKGVNIVQPYAHPALGFRNLKMCLHTSRCPSLTRNDNEE